LGLFNCFYLFVFLFLYGVSLDYPAVVCPVQQSLPLLPTTGEVSWNAVFPTLIVLSITPAKTFSLLLHFCAGINRAKIVFPKFMRRLLLKEEWHIREINFKSINDIFRYKRLNSKKLSCLQK
jgi:hypothetical protein